MLFSSVFLDGDLERQRFAVIFRLDQSFFYIVTWNDKTFAVIFRLAGRRHKRCWLRHALGGQNLSSAGSSTGRNARLPGQRNKRGMMSVLI